MTRTLFSWMLVAFIAVIPWSGALAQEVQPSEQPDETQAVSEEQAQEQVEQIGELMAAEPVIYQVTFPRVWAIVTPSFFLDGFFDMHPNHWGDGQVNFSFGGEFIIRHVERFDLIFSLDWADIRTTDDWWLESDEEIVDTDWGENSLSMLTADVAINWITVLDPTWELYYGVGLGVGIFLGDFLKQDIDVACLQASGVNPYDSRDTGLVRTWCEDDDGNPRLEPGSSKVEEDRIPPLIPALTLDFGSRWILGEHWAIQFELGFKNIYFYSGLEFGYIWD